ncbi:MAG: hypothetical protein ACJKTH_03405 [Patescibacteria group bacterium UBA2163]
MNENNTKDIVLQQRIHPILPFIAGVAIGVVLVGLIWLFTGQGSNAEVPNDATQQQQDIQNENNNTVLEQNEAGVLPTRAAQGESISLRDQVAGNVVLVDSAQFSGSVWVTVRTADSTRILGAARRDDGGTTIPVRLLAPTESGTQYEVVLYADDGDGEFDHTKDILVRGVSASFMAL